MELRRAAAPAKHSINLGETYREMMEPRLTGCRWRCCGQWAHARISSGFEFGCRPLGYGSVDSCLAPVCIGGLERVLRPTRSGRAWSLLLIRAALICARWRQIHGPLGQCCWTIVPIW